ncbi:MAG: T9SS type A sorting domain-containing protein [Bacteroidia bacterium]|nr:T9SS type A sorting domain-containing protein [Bacteroidia bacterium]
MRTILLSLAVLLSSLAMANTTGEIGGSSLQPSVSTYPNPASDRIFVNVTSAHSNVAVKIKVYDVLGKLVMTREGNDTDGVGKSNNVIDVNEFFPGIYTVVVTDGEGNSSNPIRIMVTH